MNIEFNIFKLKTESDTYKRWSKIETMNKELDAELIVVGEGKLGDKNFIKVVPINDGQICMIGGLKLDEAAYYVPEEDLYRPTDEFGGNYLNEFDIPKQYISVGIVEKIQKVNERLVS